jgi:hypothetical protein
MFSNSLQYGGNYRLPKQFLHSLLSQRLQFVSELRIFCQNLPHSKIRALAKSKDYCLAYGNPSSDPGRFHHHGWNPGSRRRPPGARSDWRVRDFVHAGGQSFL